MATRQARSARERQTVCEALVTLKGVQPQEIPYPRSNTRLAEYRAEIQEIRDFQAEFVQLGDIDPNLRVGGKITDSNFIADIAIETPGEHDPIELLNGNKDAIIQII
ncbi:hypothetical protein RhiirA5_381933 [Rhizophagus irregularis]|uniref:Uncharacterized protein n=1 Tax=Rhizophagus irregularis TaxID=588596 RepID=A0A2N0P2V5_9GLOM|nr:hypothetical protein RhiirA5_381933 [Rhizophagus irregularis]CAB5205906.1 unnamed protein product [Rhizophagus irregularis]